MISPELEIVLHRCFLSAREARHQFVTVDHLVLQMLSERAVADHLAACSIDIDRLRTELQARVSATDSVDGTEEFDTQPTMDFQRVLQKAILEVQSNGEREVSSLHLLNAMLDEDSSFAATRLLEENTGSDGAKKIRKAGARVCSLCRKPTSPDSLTTIQKRGVLCSECLIAVLKAAEEGKGEL